MSAMQRIPLQCRFSFEMPYFDDDHEEAASHDRTIPGPSSTPARESTSAYETLLGAVDEVIGQWRDMVAREPWAKIPASRLVNSFPEILPKMFRLARAGATHIDDPLRELIANAHGQFRRADGVPLISVTEEWAFLKRACRAVLDGHGFANGEAHLAMEKLDVLVDDAVGYTLRGYYRPELDSLRGRGLERRESANRRRGIADRREREED